VEEVARVRQAIHDGTLWELAERRAVAHPALRAGLAAATATPETFWPTEPESRRAFRETGPWSAARPAARRFRARLEVYRAARGPAFRVARVPLREEYLRHVPVEDRAGRALEWDAATPLGPVPLELTELYPVGPYLGVDEFDPPRSGLRSADVRRELRREHPELDHDRDWSEAWTPRQVRSLLEWVYGPGPAEDLAPRLTVERSRRTGRLRRLHHEGSVAFVLGNDALPRPTLRGGGLLNTRLPAGRGRVVVAADAAPFVRAGRTVFSKFVLGADPALVPGASALLVDPEGELLGIGRLLLAPTEMGRLRRGVAAWVTSHAASPEPDVEDDEPGAALDPP
jgi:7-cyano-7-deazaguanine tRNA-ribosyltransferase